MPAGGGCVSIPHWSDLSGAEKEVDAILSTGFNPTLVRFEPEKKDHLNHQNHRFNPTLVRFELTHTPPLLQEGPPVSIPHWSDLSGQSNAASAAGEQGFNPTLVRFELYDWLAKIQGMLRFNPTLVRFELYMICLYKSPRLVGFNPTLVRFEPLPEAARSL